MQEILEPEFTEVNKDFKILEQCRNLHFLRFSELLQRHI
jgi:hypothetical protein